MGIVVIGLKCREGAASEVTLSREIPIGPCALTAGQALALVRALCGDDPRDEFIPACLALGMVEVAHPDDLYDLEYILAVTE